MLKHIPHIASINLLHYLDLLDPSQVFRFTQGLSWRYNSHFRDYWPWTENGLGLYVDVLVGGRETGFKGILLGVNLQSVQREKS